jgi:hypothetical protein
MGKGSFCWLLRNINSNIEYYSPSNIMDGDIIKQVFEKGDRRRKTEDRRQKSEDRSQKTEDGRQKTEDGRQKTEDGRPKH